MKKETMLKTILVLMMSVVLLAMPVSVFAATSQSAIDGFRVAALVGADCYLYKGFYVGAEVGFSVSSLKIKKMENTFVNLVTDEIMTQWDTMEQRENKCYFSVEPNIRLGWTF